MASKCHLSYLAAPVTSTASSILTSFFCAFINIHDAFWWGVGTSPVSCTDLRLRPQLMNINEAGWWRTQSELRSNIRVFFFFFWFWLLMFSERDQPDAEQWPLQRMSITVTESYTQEEVKKVNVLVLKYSFFGRLFFNFQRQTDKMTGADSTESQSVWDKTH